MRVALFVPCYVDQLRPQIGFATLDLLTAAGFEVDFQEEVVCCGQPFLTAGETKRAAALGARFVDAFQNVEAIVTPSGSCAATPLRSGWQLGHAYAVRELMSNDTTRSPHVAQRTLNRCDSRTVARDERFDASRNDRHWFPERG